MKKDFFAGKVAIITGSSRGIGRATAVELANRGASVIINGRNGNRLKETENEIRKITGGISSVCCDVSTPEGAKFLIEETVKSYGKIDVLINNAGISAQGFVADLNPLVFKTVFDLNVLGVTYATIAAIPYLRETQGSVIFISSAAGIRGLPGFSAYSSSKMALKAIAESLRVEEARNKIHAGLVYVGFTENEPDKETISANGSLVPLKSRAYSKVQPVGQVAKAIVKNIERRRKITVLSPVGKLNYFTQRFLPGIGEWVILRNIKDFEARTR